MYLTQYFPDESYFAQNSYGADNFVPRSTTDWPTPLSLLSPAGREITVDDVLWATG